jgi:hypothetical protein
MNDLPLKTASVEKMDVYANPHDILHDLHMYVQYVAGRDVKRMTRSNAIPKADAKRLAKLMTNSADLLEAINDEDGSSWLYSIDRLARTLRLVNYDIKGEYRGYTSSEPSFVDNYITVSDKNYAKFLALAPAGQEKRILEILIIGKHEDPYERHTHNEFYETGAMGRQDGFVSWGAATGIMPGLDFAPIRRFLLDLLKACPTGEWFSVKSLVAYLKANHPYFIIPQKIKPDRWGSPVARYGNFHDGPDYWNNREDIPEDAPDGFERVEGRYVERFLEHIPLTLRLVELAYDPRPYTRKMYPMLDYLKGFRVTGRCRRMLNDTAQPPKVTVLPNFEIMVESEFYPAQILGRLEKLAEPLPAPAGGAPVSVRTLTLKRERVAAALVADPGLDVAARLAALSAAPLPPNIVTEIEEWSGHAEMFTLYEGFGLAETVDPLPVLDDFTSQQISAQLRLVREPPKALSALEQEGLAPVWIAHTRMDFALLPEGVRSIFPAEASIQEAEPPPPEPVTLRKVVAITLQFPFDEVFDAFRRALAEARVPVQADARVRTLTFPDTFLPALKEVIRQLGAVYDVQIDE